MTDDHYVDYTGPEAQDRQRIILQRLAPKKNNRVTERQLKDGSAKYTPRSNKECVSLGNKFTLQPGEELYAMATMDSRVKSRFWKRIHKIKKFSKAKKSCKNLDF